MTNLFSDIIIRGHVIKNRVVMPPMVCFGWSDGSGMVTDDHVRHYEDRAKDGVGLIIVEATCVDIDGRLTPSQLGIWSDGHIEGLKRISSVCHKHGVKVIIQIHHGGLQTHDEVSLDHLCPSDYDDGKSKGRAMTIDEIKGIKDKFINAAKRAETAGFDGIELHGAHGYLIDQFFSPLINKRSDEYGGSLNNRVRFACEIVKGIKASVSDSFIIGCRMGGFDPELKDGIEIAKALEECGVDILHLSAGITIDRWPEVPEGFDYNWIVYCGTQVKKHVNVPVIVVNGIRTPERASYLVENGMADFTAIGKGLLVDPNWIHKAREGAEVIPCLKCKKCNWYTDGRRCPHYVS